MAEPKTTETQPPKVDPDTGVVMAGEGGKYPLNHRLRAEALANDGETTDPDGLIADDVIADAADRLKADAKAKTEADKDSPSTRWSVDKIKARADELRATGSTIPEFAADASKSDMVDAINAATAA